MSVRNHKQKYEFDDVIVASKNFSSVDVKGALWNEQPRQEIFKTPSTSRWKNRGSTSFAHPSTSSATTIHKTPSSALRNRSYSTCTSSSRTIIPSIVIALAEGRGHARGEMGLASLDLRNPELTLSQFPDSHTYFKTLNRLHLLQPLEVIVPNTAFDSGSMNVILKLIKDNFPKTATVSVQRRYFNETKGLEYIKRLCMPECKSTEMIVADKYYALAAAAALLKYVEFIQNIIYSAKSLKVQYAGGEKTTMIDMKSCFNLELLINIDDPKSEHTLFGVLHMTKSVGGTRLLRANILQPPFCLETTESRLDCVNELFVNQELLVNLQTVISKFVDVDNLLSLCVQIPKENSIKVAEMKIANTIHLKHTLELVEPLASALENTECPFLKKYHSMLNDERYKAIYEKITEVINIDTMQHKGTLNMRAQKCFAVKSNINGLLDIARRSYAEIIDDIITLVKQLSEIHSLPLSIGHTSDKGFFIQMSINKRRPIAVEQLPSSFIKVVKIKNIIRFTTEDLLDTLTFFSMLVRAEESLNEIYLMSDTIVSKLLEDITQHIGCLYKLSEVISGVDMLIAFAEVSAASNYVRPEFTDSLAIKGGRHPILDRISTNLIVPNTAVILVQTDPIT
ncbi:MutS protein msh4 [Chamberlinius hualienensis]